MRTAHGSLVAAAVALGLCGCVESTPQVSPLACTQCGSDCVDLKTDVLHCGSCDRRCAGGETCRASQCVAGCPAGMLVCGGSCVEPQISSAFCGATGDCTGASAGAACKPGEACVAGRCEAACAADDVRCAGRCVSPATDRAWCGARLDCEGANAGQACPADQICLGGACTCPPPLVACGGGCIDPRTSVAFCGAQAPCEADAGGVACRHFEVCDEGVCKPLCGDGKILCGDQCVDPLYDDLHCGADEACSGGKVCLGAERCVGGACRLFFSTCAELASHTTRSCSWKLIPKVTRFELSLPACRAYCAARGFSHAEVVVGPSAACDPAEDLESLVADFDDCMTGLFD